MKSNLNINWTILGSINSFYWSIGEVEMKSQSWSFILSMIISSSRARWLRMFSASSELLDTVVEALAVTLLWCGSAF